MSTEEVPKRLKVDAQPSRAVVIVMPRALCPQRWARQLAPRATANLCARGLFVPLSEIVGFPQQTARAV